VSIMTFKVLIVGKGVAALSLAYFLNERGIKGVVVGRRSNASAYSPWNMLFKDDMEAFIKEQTHGFAQQFLLDYYFTYLKDALKVFDVLGIELRESNLGFIPTVSGFAVLAAFERFLKDQGWVLVEDDVVEVEGQRALLKSGTVVKFERLVLANGSFGQLFAYASSPYSPYSFHAALFDKGVKLSLLPYNMFHPFLFLHPKVPRTIGSGPALLSMFEFLDTREQAVFPPELRAAIDENRYHHRFPELITHLFDAYKRGGVKAVLRVDWATFERYKKEGEFGWLFRNVRSAEELKGLSVVPAFHYSCGGFEINDVFQVGDLNVYAIGASVSSTFGVNRIGGTAMMEGMTHAKALSERWTETNVCDVERVVVPRVSEDVQFKFYNVVGPVKERAVLKAELERVNDNSVFDRLLKEFIEQSLSYPVIGTHMMK